MNNVSVITRSFQPGKSVDTFDQSAFEKHKASFSTMLGNPEMARLIVMVCGGGKFSEIPDADGNYPTAVFLKEAFPKEVESGKLVLRVCFDWGNNPGSSTALNEGLEIAKENKSEWVLNWSPETEVDSSLIGEMVAFAKENKLDVVGGARERWQEKIQWSVPQSIMALWRVEALSEIGGFSKECEGNGETVFVEGFGEVPLAGFEDFDAMLRMMKNDPDFRWGMVRKNKPLKWDTDFDPGSERESRHLAKVARQSLVMEHWAKNIFPEMSFDEVMENFFSRECK